MAKVVSLRLPEELLEWADGYAELRGVSRTDLLVEGLRSFKEDCENGVPEIRQVARRQSSVRGSDGVGVCPAREDGLGHVWASPRSDPDRACVFGCGVKGRAPEVPGVPNGGFLARAGAERAEFFSRLAVPMQSGSGKAPGKGGK